MASQYRACKTCHEETAPDQLEAIAGEEKTLSVTLREFPVLTCANGHKQFLRAEFPLQLLNHLVEEDEAQLPAGEEKGLLFKHFYCSDCGNELQPKPDHEHTFTMDVALPDAAPFKVDLTMPVYKCGGCGKEQLHSLKEARKQTPAALVHAFEAAGIPKA